MDVLELIDKLDDLIHNARVQNGRKVLDAAERRHGRSFVGDGCVDESDDAESELAMAVDPLCEVDRRRPVPDDEQEAGARAASAKDAESEPKDGPPDDRRDCLGENEVDNEEPADLAEFDRVQQPKGQDGEDDGRSDDVGKVRTDPPPRPHPVQVREEQGRYPEGGENTGGKAGFDSDPLPGLAPPRSEAELGNKAEDSERADRVAGH